MLKNEEFGFCLFDIPYITANRDAIVEDSRAAVARYKKIRPVEGNDITWQYMNYNVFSLANGSVHYYQIYKGLSDCIARYFDAFGIQRPDQLWMQSWINFHQPGQLLKLHSHQWKLHGYLSIDPKDTLTVFTKDEKGEEAYAVKNMPGQVYIGPGFRYHYVKQLADFDSERITLGFDLEMDKKSGNLGMIPVIV